MRKFVAFLGAVLASSFAAADHEGKARSVWMFTNVQQQSNIEFEHPQRSDHLGKRLQRSP